MQVNVSLIVGVLIGAVAIAPGPAPSAHAVPARGAWGGAASAEHRAPSPAGDAVWEIAGGCGRVESRIDRAGSVHRVMAAWTALADTLVPGEAVPLSASALVLEAGVDADCTVDVVAWQGERDAATPFTVHLVGTSLPPGEQIGAVAQATAAWRVPGPEATSGALHVRVTVTHRGNAIALTRSYAWMPAGPEVAD